MAEHAAPIEDQVSGSAPEADTSARDRALQEWRGREGGAASQPVPFRARKAASNEPAGRRVVELPAEREAPQDQGTVNPAALRKGVLRRHPFASVLGGLA